MKKIAVAFVLVFALAFVATAAEFTGFIADSNCAAKQGAKAASEKHANCAAKCIKGGAAAVLVTADGKVYKIDDQSKVADHAGHKVTIMGDVQDDTIKVDTVKMAE